VSSRRIGVAAAAAHIASVNDALIEAARPFGLKANTPDRAGHYLSLALPSDAPADLAQQLDAHGVKVSQRGPRLRVSPHVYSDAEDVARFAAGLESRAGMTPTQPGVKGWGGLAALAILWGGAFAFITVAVESVPPSLVAFGRLLLAAVLLTAWTVHQKRPLPPLR
jgi:hypothetical protein